MTVGLNTHTEKIQAAIDQDEILFRARNNELLTWSSFQDWADQVKAQNPNLLRGQYCIYRKINDGTSSEWENYATGVANPPVDPEVGYLHHSGVRFDDGGSNGWYMDINNSAYQAFQIDRTIKLINNVWWGPVSNQATVPWEAYVNDLTLWHAEFDVGQVSDSDEYGSYALNQWHPYASGQVVFAQNLRDGVEAAFPTRTIHMIPNHGDMVSAQDQDINTLDLYDVVDWVYPQVTWSLPAADNKLDVTILERDLDFIQAVLGDGKYFVGAFYDYSGTAGAKTAKGQMMAAAMFFLVQHSRLYARYFTDMAQSNHVRDWEYSPILRCRLLGEPLGPRFDATGQGRLKARNFENGMVLLYVKAVKTAASDSFVYPLPQAGWLLDEEGAFSDTQVTEVTLDSNEGAIVIFDIPDPNLPQATAVTGITGLMVYDAGYTYPTNQPAQMGGYSVNLYKGDILRSLGLVLPRFDDEFDETSHSYLANMTYNTQTVFSNRPVDFRRRQGLTNVSGDLTPVLIMDWASGDLSQVEHNYELQYRAVNAADTSLVRYFPKVTISLEEPL